jgi:YesN/AraC family two-component response regulator
MTMTTTTKRRILFVDDEQNVLDGLRNLLRRQRHVWEMSFALSGRDALDQMERVQVDVIV